MTAANRWRLPAAFLLAMGIVCCTRSANGGKMIFETIKVGPIETNCFILGCEETQEGVVVDPGGDVGKILAVVKRHGLKVKYVINTHGHFDHVGGNRPLMEATGAELLIHRSDVPMLGRAVDVAKTFGLETENSPEPHRLLEDGMAIGFGRHTMQVLHTPGHTPGGCSLYLAAQGMVITGDTLFADGVGRTDFPGSSHEALVKGIQTKLFTLPDDTRAYPGHGPATTIGHEKRHNPYVTL
jgi:glyoxylase-like metal-dependent hydrolase (beta-lactamase superfamily II)